MGRGENYLDQSTAFSDRSFSPVVPGVPYGLAYQRIFSLAPTRIVERSLYCFQALGIFVSRFRSPSGSFLRASIGNQIAVGLLLTRTVDGSKFHNRRQGALLFVGP